VSQGPLQRRADSELGRYEDGCRPDWRHGDKKMRQKAFSGELRQLCLDHANPVPGATTRFSSPLAKNSQTFPLALRSAEKALFEQLLLFDTVQLSVTGANVIAPLLCNRMGRKVFEDLLDQDAITFVQWEPEPMFSHREGLVKATFSGRFGGGGPIDIEKRIDQGFLLEHAAAPASRDGLKKKLIRQTSILEEKFGEEAWQEAFKAMSEGSLEHLGLSRRSTILNAPVRDGQILSDAAASLLSYRHILANNMISTGNESVYDFFSRGLTSLERPDLRLEQFGFLANIEQFPNLQELFGEIKDPFLHAAKFRKSDVARTFRAWMSTIEGAKSDRDAVTREYVKALMAKRSFFEAAPRKFLKAVSVAALGSAASATATALGAGELAAGLAGLTGLAAPTVAALQGKAMNSGVGLFGNFIIDNLKPEWTPKAYFDGLRNMKKKSERQ
jgi:hypothetical protein